MAKQTYELITPTGSLYVFVSRPISDDAFENQFLKAFPNTILYWRKLDRKTDDELIAGDFLELTLDGKILVPKT